jgi:hypothetical protein
MLIHHVQTIVLKAVCEVWHPPSYRSGIYGSRV